jgi:hypothetical protein
VPIFRQRPPSPRHFGICQQKYRSAIPLWLLRFRVRQNGAIDEAQ